MDEQTLRPTDDDPFRADTPEELDRLSAPAPQRGVIETPWVSAPSDSHLKEFRLVDKSNDPIGEVPSLLFVTLRATTAKRTGVLRPESTYKYESYDHTALRGTFEKMSSSSDPGEILHAELVSKGNKGSPA